LFADVSGESGLATGGGVVGVLVIAEVARFAFRVEGRCLVRERGFGGSEIFFEFRFPVVALREGYPAFANGVVQDRGDQFVWREFACSVTSANSACVVLSAE
jgi:hypothetical protein